MNRLRVLAVLAAGGFTLPAHAGCEQPAVTIIPPADQFVEQKDAVEEEKNEYFQGMYEYLQCIRAELESAGEDASDLYKRMLVRRNDLAVAELKAVERWWDSRFPAEAGAQGASVMPSSPGRYAAPR